MIFMEAWELSLGNFHILEALREYLGHIFYDIVITTFTVLKDTSKRLPH